MNGKLYDDYVSILRSELVPALGCTEPIAIAYAGAKVREALGCLPERIEVYCSGNIIKNVKGVVVPKSEGMKGIDVAAILGILGGDPKLNLAVLESVQPSHLIKTKELLKQGYCRCGLAEDVPNLYILMKGWADGHEVQVEIKYRHVQIAKIIKDGEVIFENNCEEDEIPQDDPRGTLSVDSILEFANSVHIEDVKEILDRQISYNSEISKEGLHKNYGAAIGKTLIECYPDDVKVRAKAAAAAGSDARMNGCSMPVIINSGSGNQGMTVSLPVLAFAKEWEIPMDKVYRALIISNLTAIHQKYFLGDLSAYCGVVCAACGSGAAITYMADGTRTQIENTITNTIVNIGGMVCDGAKASCAAKIASAVEAAILGHCMSMKEKVFESGEGLVKDNVEKTIECVGRMGRVGMKSTDKEILQIMLED